MVLYRDTEYTWVCGTFKSLTSCGETLFNWLVKVENWKTYYYLTSQKQTFSLNNVTCCNPTIKGNEWHQCIDCVCKLRKLGVNWDFVLCKFILGNFLTQPKQYVSWDCMRIFRAWSSHHRRLSRPQEFWVLAAAHTRISVRFCFQCAQHLPLHLNCSFCIEICFRI